MTAEYDGHFDGVTPFSDSPSSPCRYPMGQRHGDGNPGLLGDVCLWGTALGIAVAAARLDGSWTELDTRSRAEAEMEFGLIVSPHRSDRRFQLDFYRLELNQPGCYPDHCAPSCFSGSI